jgi:hypothetical protein
MRAACLISGLMILACGCQTPTTQYSSVVTVHPAPRNMQGYYVRTQILKSRPGDNPIPVSSPGIIVNEGQSANVSGSHGAEDIIVNATILRKTETLKAIVSLSIKTENTIVWTNTQTVVINEK